MSSVHRLVVTPRVVPVRFAPRVGVGLRGSVAVAKFNREGKRVPVRVDRNKRVWQRVWDHRQPNLITNAGMDFCMGDSSSTIWFERLISYVAVGTGSATPAVTDTALGNEIARTTATLDVGEDKTGVAPSDGVGEYTRVRTFDYDEANGNLTEFGGAASTFASEPTILTRNLFLDELDAPTTITKTSDEQLRITYTLTSTVSGPTVLTAASDLVFTGYGSIEADWIQYPLAAVKAWDGSDTVPSDFPAGLFSMTGRVTFLRQNFPSSYLDESISNDQSVGIGNTGLGGFQTYIGGSYERDLVATWPTTASDAPAIGMIIGETTGSNLTPYWGWRFTNPATFTKEAEYRVIVNATVAVTRT